ncbi:hypothetical protein IWZ00DRAFT_484306 [Phyllosticta capitalensis]
MPGPLPSRLFFFSNTLAPLPLPLHLSPSTTTTTSSSFCSYAPAFLHPTDPPLFGDAYIGKKGRCWHTPPSPPPPPPPHAYLHVEQSPLELAPYDDAQGASHRIAQPRAEMDDDATTTTKTRSGREQMGNGARAVEQIWTDI